MIDIRDKSKCTGCSACSEICPKHCIEMTYDEEGFKYPKVLKEQCISCGLCEQVCPVKNITDTHGTKAAYAVQNSSEELRMNSTSGGAVSAIAKYVFKKGGAVAGAKLDNDCRVIHSLAYSEEEIKKFQGSKYVQSDLGHIFTEIKSLLQEGTYVLFCGMPCQVAGLKSYLMKEYENLITVDLACHGVPSPEIFSSYIEYLEFKHKKLVQNVVFRDKTYGYSSSNMKVYFEDGTSRDCRYDVKTFNSMMFKGLSLRPSCYACSFKTVERVSDFTLFDCTMVGHFIKSFDDNKGTTNVIIHTEKGLKIFEDTFVSCSMRCTVVNADDVIKTEGTMLLKSADANPLRKQFFEDRKNMTYEKLAKKYVPLTLKTRIGNIIKPLLRHSRLLTRIITGMNKERSIKEYQKKYGMKNV